MIIKPPFGRTFFGLLFPGIQQANISYSLFQNLKLTAKAPEIGWLEYDPFLLGPMADQAREAAMAAGANAEEVDLSPVTVWMVPGGSRIQLYLSYLDFLYISKVLLPSLKRTEVGVY